MPFPLFGLIRALALAAVALGAIAVGLGRLHPSQPLPRIAASVDHVGLPSYTKQRLESSADYLDLRAGDVRQFDLPPGDSLENQSFSPWRDANGQSQVVGRWGQRGGSASENESGLGRYTFPDGEALDRIPTDFLPMGLPCWFPDRSARVLFAAGDGKLYRVDFEEQPRRDGTSEGPTPRALTWAHPPEGCQEFDVRDPSWPTDPILAGGVLVSITNRVLIQGHQVQERPKLWWLRLNAAGTEIIASKRLTREGATPGPAENRDERLPTFGRSTTGEPLLAFLTREHHDEPWGLRVAPIRVDPVDGSPRASVLSAAVLAEDCTLFPPTFSTDGRWVVGLRNANALTFQYRRFPIPNAHPGD